MDDPQCTSTSWLLDYKWPLLCFFSTSEVYYLLQVTRACPGAKDGWPFTYTCMDIFGLWHIKEGQKELKRWGLIFTCLYSRAIHLETLNSVETNAFINVLRRFYQPKRQSSWTKKWSRNKFYGTLKNAVLKEVNTNFVKNFLLTQDCDLIEFKMNVPSASNMGGIWKRLIRTDQTFLAFSKTMPSAWWPDPYTRKRWRWVQYPVEQFWCRWQQEYCLLQK